MSFNIGELVGHIKIDHAGVKTGMAAAQREVSAGQAKIAQTSEQGGKQAGSRFSTGVTSVTKSGLASLTTAVVGAFAVERVVSYLGDATKAASDLQQTTMKSNVIFGQSAASIDKWAQTSDKSFGLSKEAALAAAAQFGDMFLQLGDTEEQAASTSTEIVQLAADLGSFNNLPTGDVLERISAAMRGEYDSLQLLIPNISAARVETEALAATGKKSASQLTAQEKAHATLAIIQRDGARAQGDFARSAGTLAVEQQKADAAAENLRAKLGEKLVPIMTELAKFTSGTVIPAFSSLIDIVSDVAAGIADVPGPVKAAVVALVAFHMLSGPLGKLGTTAQTTFGKITAGAKSAGSPLNMLKGGASGLLGILGGPWGIAFAGATTAVTLWMQAQENAKTAADGLYETMDKVNGAFTKASGNSVRDAIMGDLAPADQLLLQDIGISLTDGAQAALEGGPKLAAYRDRLTELSREQAGLFGTDTSRAIDGYNSSLENSSEVVQMAKDKAAALKNEQKEVAGATRETGAAAEKAQPPVQSLVDVTQLLAEAAQSARQAQKDLADATLAVTDAAITADSANADLEASYDDARKAINENGKSVNKNRTQLNLSTEAGRSNQAVLQTIATKASTAAEANLKNGRSVDSVKRSMETARGVFIENARKAGLSKEAAEAMATQYGLTRGRVDQLNTSMGKTPKQVKAEITVATAAAKIAIAGVQALLRAVNGQVATTSIITRRVTINESRLSSNGVNPNLRFGGRVPGYAGGTLVGPGTGTSDSIPAFVAQTGRALAVSNGEFISTDSSRRRNEAALLAGNRGAKLSVVQPGSEGGNAVSVQVFIGDEEVTGRARVVVREELDSRAAHDRRRLRQQVGVR